MAVPSFTIMTPQLTLLFSNRLERTRQRAGPLACAVLRPYFEIVTNFDTQILPINYPSLKLANVHIGTPCQDCVHVSGCISSQYIVAM